jgi:glycosyltransferase involved in cell wall biosynthesis
MKAVLVCAPYFAPNYLAGGSVKAVVNTVLGLHADFDFWIVAQDRYPKASAQPSADPSVEWQSFGSAHVRYLNPDQRGLLHLFKLLRSTPSDLLFLNSFFSPTAAIKPLLCNLLLRKPIVLAPRGELLQGALAQKPWRKRIYLAAFRLVRLGAQVQWLASSAIEADALRRIFGKDVRLHTIADPILSEPAPQQNFALDSTQGLRLAFVSRIDRKKNLSFALQVLAAHPSAIQLDVFGPIDDEVHWKELQGQIARLPGHVAVAYRGSLAPAEVIPTLASYHALFLPTLGENFGYVFVEALLAGCPLVISDTTPWRGLKKEGVGWDLDLKCPHSFARALQELKCQSLGEHRAMRARARAYGLSLLRDNAALPALRGLLETVAGANRST